MTFHSNDLLIAMPGKYDPQSAREVAEQMNQAAEAIAKELTPGAVPGMVEEMMARETVWNQWVGEAYEAENNPEGLRGRWLMENLPEPARTLFSDPILYQEIVDPGDWEMFDWEDQAEIDDTILRKNRFYSEVTLPQILADYWQEMEADLTRDVKENPTGRFVEENPAELRIWDIRRMVENQVGMEEYYERKLIAWERLLPHIVTSVTIWMRVETSRPLLPWQQDVLQGE